MLDAEAIGRRFADVKPLWVLAAWLLVAVALAWNRGVGLLWGMVWLLVAALAVAVLYPLAQLRRVAIRRDVPPEATVGEAAHVTYTIDAGAWPIFGLELWERFGDDDTPVLAACLGRVRGRETVRLAWTPGVRGRRTFGAVTLASGFPLGLATRRLTVELPEQATIVHPDAVRLRALPIANGAQSVLEEAPLRARGGHDDYVGSRPWRTGDAFRDVHWRAVARRGELVVKEHDRALDRDLWIVLELSRDAHAGAGRAGTLETMFRVASSVLSRARADRVPVGLVCREHGVLRVLRPALDGHAYAHLRDVLALVEADRGPPLGVWLPRAHAELPLGGTWLVFAPAGGARRALLDACRARRASALLVEFDRTPDAPGAPTAALVQAVEGAQVARVRPTTDLTTLFG
jgi:uncharacterized protein (DUF58 family)